MNILLAFAGEAIVIGIAVAVVMWIARRDEEEGRQQPVNDPERQETTQYSSMQDD